MKNIYRKILKWILSLIGIIVIGYVGLMYFAVYTDTQKTEGYESTSIWELSEVEITENTNPIKLKFIGHWTFGGERGSMEINRANGSNSFCLSW